MTGKTKSNVTLSSFLQPFSIPRCKELKSVHKFSKNKKRKENASKLKSCYTYVTVYYNEEMKRLKLANVKSHQKKQLMITLLVLGFGWFWLAHYFSLEMKMSRSFERS